MHSCKLKQIFKNITLLKNWLKLRKENHTIWLHKSSITTCFSSTWKRMPLENSQNQQESWWKKSLSLLETLMTSRSNSMLRFPCFIFFGNFFLGIIILIGLFCHISGTWTLWFRLVLAYLESNFKQAWNHWHTWCWITNFKRSSSTHDCWCLGTRILPPISKPQSWLFGKDLVLVELGRNCKKIAINYYKPMCINTEIKEDFSFLLSKNQCIRNYNKIGHEHFFGYCRLSRSIKWIS